MAKARNEKQVGQKDPFANGEEANAVTSEDLSLESEREALKNARDAETPQGAEGDGFNAHGNLHFGDRMTGEWKDAGDTREGGEFSPPPDNASRNDGSRGGKGGENAAGDGVMFNESLTPQAEEGAPDSASGAGNTVGSSAAPAAQNFSVSEAKNAGAASQPRGATAAQEATFASRSDGEPNDGDDNRAPVNEAPTDISLSDNVVAENDAGAVIARLSATDPDADDSATFSLVEDPSGLFEIVGGELRLKDGVSLDHEAQDAYEIVIQVEDGAGNIYTKTFAINVADLNEGPTDLQLSSASINENEAGAVVGTLSAFDPDAGDTLAFAVSDDRFEVVGNELKVKDGVSFDHETVNALDVTVTATDTGGLTTSESFTIDIADLNESPADLQLSNTSINENEAGAVVGTLSAIDPDAGDTLAFTVSDDRFEIVGDQLKVKDGVSFDHETVNALDVTVTATDTDGLTTSESFTITIADINESPADLQLSNTSINENEAGAVVGTLSAVDPDAGDTLAFAVSDDRFEVVGNELKLKDGVELDFNDAETIGVTVTATDSGGASVSQSFAIGVNDVNEGPALGLASGAGLKASYYNIRHSLSNLDQIDFDAAPDAEAVVGSLDYMHGQDAFWDGAPNDYFAAKYEGQLVVETGGTYTFNMASDDGSMLFIDSEPVLDNDGLHATRMRSVTLELEEGAHDIEVRYFENGGSQTLQLAWSGPDTGGANEVIGGGAFQHGYTEDNLSVAEDQTGAVVAELTVTDPDAGDTHTFSVDDDRFEVVESDGAYVLKLKDGVSLDYETEAAVDVSVTVTDAAGASDTAQYSIAVDNTNTAPEIDVVGGEGLKASYYDIGHSLSNLDQIDFDATPDAEAVVGSLDYMQGQDAFWDGAPNNYFAAKYEGQLMVDEGGTYTFSMASDDGSMLFIDGEPVLDNDGLHSTRTRTVTLELEEGAHDIEVRYFENGGSQTLQLAWSGPDTGGEQQVIGGGAYRLPGYTDQDQLGLSENAPGDVAAVLSITDAEGDVVTYEVDDDRFELVENENGVALKLKDGVSVDHEAGDQIRVTITATDEHGESSSTTLSIPVADINETPTDIALSNDGISENSAGATVATLSAADPDAGDTATFSITEDASGLFEVVGNELKLKDGASLDYEAQDSYDITLQVTDSGGASYSETVTINVADVNEAPVDFILEPVSRGALSLNEDGGNNDVAIAANMEGFPTKALTVEVTFASSQSDVGDGVPLFSYAASTGSNNEALLFLEGKSGNLNVYLAGQKVNTGIPNSSLLDGEQHQVSFTWDQASNELKVYVDGQEEFASSINIRDLKADGSVAFGQEQDSEGGGYASNQIFEGQISEARIFDYARSGEEIADNAGQSLSEPEAQTGLVSNWIMNASEGGVVSDIAGNNDLQLLNGAEIKDGEAYDAPTVIENDAGAVVGTLSAVDPDSGAPITDFSIAEDASGLFEVVGDQLKLKDGVSLDHETQDSYELTVQATDADGASTLQTVTINVADVNEAPINVTFDPEVMNGVLSLNQDGGRNDYAIASNLEGFPTDALTVEVSFASSQTDVGNGVPLFSYAASNGSDNEALLWLEGASGNLNVFLAGQKINTGIPNSSLLDGEQHQVSFSWDQFTNELKVYVDGEQEFAKSVNIRDLKADGTLVLGQEQDAEGGRFDSRQVFEGEVIEVRIFDYARSDEEIADHIGKPFDDPETEPGLINNWLMNEEKGGAIEDLVGVDHMQLQGGASVVDSEHGAVPTVAENDAGAIVGTISATDPQTGGAVTAFAIADDPSGLFEMVGDQLKVKDGVSLDYETQDSYDVTLEAIGAGGESAFYTVSVNVADISEGPIVANIDLGAGKEDTSFVITEAQLLAGSSHPEGAALSIADLSVDPGFGALADNGDGSWTFTPSIDLSADDVAFEFTVSDGENIGLGVATLDIEAVADAPILTISPVQQVELGSSNTVSSGFEGGALDTAASGSAWVGSFGDWQTTSDAIEVKQETLADGSTNQFIELNDDAINYYDDASNVYRTINTQEGATYTLDFEYAPRPGYGANVNEIEVVINGEVVETISADGKGDSAVNWQTHTVTFTGDGSDMSVEFRASGEAVDYGRGMYLDDISITEDMPAGVVSGNDGGPIVLPAIGVSSADSDGSETLSTTISDLPDGFVISDGDHSFTAGGGSNEIDVSEWALDQLTVTPSEGYAGEVNLTVTATSTDGDSLAQTVDMITIDVQSADDDIQGTNATDILDGGAGNDTIYGRDGDDVIIGGKGDDELFGGAGDDVFVYEMGDGSDVVHGGDGKWTDSIQLSDGETPLGAFGTDWTIDLTEGSVISSDENGITFTDNADGVITLNDGSTISFTDIEEVVI